MNLKKKVATVGAAAAVLATFSMPSHAMRETEAGEANLVPFVVWDSNPGDIQQEGDIGFGINTIVKLTVPADVGNDVIPNYYTAPWTSPTPAGSTKSSPGPQLPGKPSSFTGTQTIHWFFLNQYSQHVLDGTLTVTPDDVVVMDWGATVGSSGKTGEIDGQPGYLVFTTEKASTGLAAADFSFFAEAWLIAGVTVELDDPTPKIGTVEVLGTGNGVLGVIDAKIPVMPMSDGVDNSVDAAPTVLNQVIEKGKNGSIWASPLVGGIRTNWSDGDPTDITVVDVTLGNRSIQIGDVTNPLQYPTLVVAWNDRNASNWSSVLVDIFNDDEESCSDSVDLSKQLNLLWVNTTVSAWYPEPRFAKNYAVEHSPYCVPPIGPNATQLDALKQLLSGGFMKFQLPEPVDNNLHAPESSAVFFSIPLQYNVVTQPDAISGNTVVTDISLIPFATALGHARGTFTQ